MPDTRKLPVGIENFEKLRQENFYYVDKTGLIIDLLQKWAEVNLITRPRRFGKTLNMSMLQNFLEIGADPALFEGLRISQNKDICDEYMGQYPVIFVTLKGVDGQTFEDAVTMLKIAVQAEVRRHAYLKTSNRVSADNKRNLERLLQGDDETFVDSLRLLSEILYEHYNRRVILLIDEYDVPLDKAFQNGYYREMVSLIRGFLVQALKTNNYLQFSVLTGCLRIAKESIFTGFNNFKVLSIADVRFDEYFGFTDADVQRILEDYGLIEHYPAVKEWYDGYHFGDTDIYCPWDVINYVDLLCERPNARPQAFWINSSGNSLVRRFVDKADTITRGEIERLVAGESISKAVALELTYDEIDDSISNLWSVLFTTGYLTTQGESDSGEYQLVIPNLEVRQVFVDQIQKWFEDTVLKDTTSTQMFYQAFLDGNALAVERHLKSILKRTISIQDTRARDGQKENFYHGLLLGLLRNGINWDIKSNVEAGDGFCDIVVESQDSETGIVLELKYTTDPRDLDNACEHAMQQIKDRRYDEYLRNDGYDRVLAYGMAFCKKTCKVIAENL